MGAFGDNAEGLAQIDLLADGVSILSVDASSSGGIEELDSLIDQIMLEVRASARDARAFYGGFGYREVERIRGYYQGREDAVRMVADLVRYDAAPGFPTPDGGRPDPTKATGRLERWSFDLSGATDDPKVEILDDLGSEFPRLDERFAGLPYRHGFMASTEGPGAKNALFDQVVHVDHETAKVSRWHAGTDCFVGEPIFVPRAPDAAEGDGYLLSIVYVGPESRSDLAVFDALDVESGPRARARLDLRVPHGFHGNWIPA